MAKSKVKKSFVYYLIMFLATLLGIACIFAAILVFNPGQDVLGIGVRFVNYNKTVEYYKTNEADEALQTKIEGAGFSTVKFTSGFTNFNIGYDPDAVSTRVQFRPSVTALSRSEKVDFKIHITISGGVLNISMTEPELWVGFSDTATVYLICPKNKTFSSLNFDITTTTGAIKFGDATNRTYAVNSLKLKSDCGAIEIEKNLNITSGNASILTNSSRVTVKADIKNTLTIENNSGKVNVDKISGNAHLINTGTLEANLAKVGGDVLLNSKNGYIKIGELGTTEISSSSGTRKEIGYVDKPASGESIVAYHNGNFVGEINIENTNVIIGKMTGDADIEGQTGYIVIDKLGKKADIATTSGSIEIKYAQANVDALTTSGAIVVTQYSSTAGTILISETGSITSNFTNLGTASLTTNGDIYVNVVTGIAFKFDYSAKAISVNWISTPLDLTGTILVSGATNATTQVVTAATGNGRITLKDGFIAA